MIRRLWVISLLMVNIFAGIDDNTTQTIYYNLDHYLIEGTCVADSLKENPFDRLPVSYKEKVQQPVWNLSKNSAGISVRFQTNSAKISVRWELLNDFSMNHMTDTGIKGLDMYIMTPKGWQYVNSARPKGKINESTLMEKMPNELREYRFFLPLYDGVTNLEIGIDSLSEIQKPEKRKTKPIVFYGTSITQGGCASRPGMAYTNIISRKLDLDCINLGFSGNGRMEMPIVEIMAGIEAEFYMIDCLPNMTVEQVRENTQSLVQKLREKQPETPVVFVENIMYESAYFDKESLETIQMKNKVLREEVAKLVKSGYRNISIIDTRNSLGEDHEATVDGVHFTDLGFMRFADFLIDRFSQLELIKAGSTK